jgi:hypothetical protein
MHAMTSTEVRWLVAHYNPSALFADGFDPALIGVVRGKDDCAVAAYARSGCITVLTQSGISQQDAEEHFEFNVQGAYLGKHTPVFIDL